MLKKVMAVVLTLSMILPGLTGCADNSGFLSGGTKKNAEITKSNEIYIPIEKIRTLNPVVSKDEDSYYIDCLLYEGLFTYDKTLTLTPVLADSYEYENQGLSAKIRLKKGIQWQDGQSFTAEDVKFSIDAYMKASYGNLTLYGNHVKNIKSVTVDKNDPYSVTVNYSSNNNVSMGNLTFPILPKHKYKSVDALINSVSNFSPLGTGPYKLTDYNELNHITLAGNERYQGEVPQNILNFETFPDKKDAINLMEVNNISLIFSKEADRNTRYQNQDVNVVSFLSNEVELLGFNFRNAAMKNKYVRKAIAYSIDTQEILEAGYFKNGILNDNIYYPNYLGTPSVENQYSYDLKKARSLLMEAGYTDRNGDGLAENANNEVITVNILVNSDNQSRVAVAQIIKEGLDQLPIQTHITSVDWDSYQSDLASGKFDLYLGGYEIRENYDMRFLLHSNYANPAGYSNPALDVLLDKMSSGITADEKKQTFTQIREILDGEIPYFCLLYRTYGAIASPSLKGNLDPLFFNLYHGCENWSCEYIKQEADEGAE